MISANNVFSVINDFGLFRLQPEQVARFISHNPDRQTAKVRLWLLKISASTLSCHPKLSDPPSFFEVTSLWVCVLFSRGTLTILERSEILLYMNKQKRPTAEYRSLSLTQVALAKLIPKDLVLTLSLKAVKVVF